MTGLVIGITKNRKRERIQKMVTMEMPQDERGPHPSNHLYSKMVSGLSVVSGSVGESSGGSRGPAGNALKKHIKAFPGG
jgi:hypothetical protein